MHLCITPQRSEKTGMLMRALRRGGVGEIVYGAPKDAGEFAVWGQMLLATQIIPPAHREGRPYWQIDNGYWMPAKGLATGYYSLCYRGLWPVLLADPDMDRIRVPMAPWRERRDGYVLIALPGMGFGGLLGFDMPAWADGIRRDVAKRTDRKIKVRDKKSRVPLADDLAGAAVVVTHSSKVAVDAVIAGVPCIVAPTNPAAPVSSTDLNDIETPRRPDRARWFASLMCQQFTVAEMADGTAKFWMERIRAHVDSGDAGALACGATGREAPLQAGGL